MPLPRYPGEHMSGEDLETFREEANGGAAIGTTFLFQDVNFAKALVEQLRPWMVLRSTDSSKTVATSNTWQTAIDLSTIARFSRKRVASAAMLAVDVSYAAATIGEWFSAAQFHGSRSSMRLIG